MCIASAMFAYILKAPSSNLFVTTVAIATQFVVNLNVGAGIVSNIYAALNWFVVDEKMLDIYRARASLSKETK